MVTVGAGDSTIATTNTTIAVNKASGVVKGELINSMGVVVPVVVWGLHILPLPTLVLPQSAVQTEFLNHCYN